MKQIVMLLAFAAITVGCKAQIPPNPTVFTCPAVGTYAALNQATPATGLTYTDTHPAAGTYCYIAQSVDAATGQISVTSNIAGPFTLSGSNSTLLTWTPPTSGPTPSGYVLSRAAAVSSTLIAPVLGAGSVAQNVTPALPMQETQKPTYLAAIKAPAILTARVR